MNKILTMGSLVLVGSLSYGVELSTDTYQIKSKYSDNCIKLESIKSAIGSKLIQGSCSESDGRDEFTFSKVNDKYYSISNQNGLYLSIPSESKSNGVNIIMSNTPTLFKLEKKKNNYKIKGENSNKYITVEYTSMDIVQYSKHNNIDQLWILSPKDASNDNSNNESETITYNNVTYKTITSPITGKTWLDRNLGAEQVCTSFNDASCYGNYYDKNQRLENDICPTGYKVPSWTELSAETIDDSIQDSDVEKNGNIEVLNSYTAYENFLKLPSAGLIYSNGRPNYTGTVGDVWTTSTEGLLRFNSSVAVSDNNYQNNSFSIRCMEY